MVRGRDGHVLLEMTSTGSKQPLSHALTLQHNSYFASWMVRVGLNVVVVIGIVVGGLAIASWFHPDRRGWFRPPACGH
jgi:hypothetical protein